MHTPGEQAIKSSVLLIAMAKKNSWKLDFPEEGNEEDFHKSLGKLKDTDPEFYKFLQENDKDVFQEDEQEGDEEEQPAQVFLL